MLVGVALAVYVTYLLVVRGWFGDPVRRARLRALPFSRVLPVWLVAMSIGFLVVAGAQRLGLAPVGSYALMILFVGVPSMAFMVWGGMLGNEPEDGSGQ